MTPHQRDTVQNQTDHQDETNESATYELAFNGLVSNKNKNDD